MVNYTCIFFPLDHKGAKIGLPETSTKKEREFQPCDSGMIFFYSISYNTRLHLIVPPILIHPFGAPASPTLPTRKSIS